MSGTNRQKILTSKSTCHRVSGSSAAVARKRYVIRVTQKAKPWVLEDPWHPEQKVKELKDGCIEISFTAAHDMEVIPRVLALAGEATIIKPEKCRDKVAESVQRIAEAHEVG